MSSLVSRDAHLPELLGKHIRELGFVDIVSKGTSMYPFIKEGDNCRFVACPPDSVAYGDVLLYRTFRGKLVGHRLMAVTRLEDTVYLVTKGDTNAYPDEPIPSDALLGKLVRIQRRKRDIYLDAYARRVWTWSILHVPFISKASRTFLVQKHIWEHRIQRALGR